MRTQSGDVRYGVWLAGDAARQQDCAPAGGEPAGATERRPTYEEKLAAALAVVRAELPACDHCEEN
jgi:hypothetical protein